MRANGGFTLLELILVMVIIGILAGMVTFAVAGRGTEARELRAKADLSIYQKAIEAYALEHNDQYPKQLSDLVSKDKSYVIQIKKDGWANPYVYRYPGKKNKYDLYSRGADAQDGTEDDISVWDED
ncbi:MAG: prepilin-type N-terminal cleavage/methylation domain-containing protein [bacterium]|nr:prepilin-type N-terminal cleavage/methylation domain-containing protein [bacterium]